MEDGISAMETCEAGHGAWKAASMKTGRNVGQSVCSKTSRSGGFESSCFQQLCKSDSHVMVDRKDNLVSSRCGCRILPAHQNGWIKQRMAIPQITPADATYKTLLVGKTGREKTQCR